MLGNGQIDEQEHGIQPEVPGKKPFVVHLGGKKKHTTTENKN